MGEVHPAFPSLPVPPSALAASPVLLESAPVPLSVPSSSETSSPPAHAPSAAHVNKATQTRIG
jgi:hypothetical protein